jgi:hypothetical protein
LFYTIRGQTRTLTLSTPTYIEIPLSNLYIMGSISFFSFAHTTTVRPEIIVTPYII